jgi:hypothetical protein
MRIPRDVSEVRIERFRPARSIVSGRPQGWRRAIGWLGRWRLELSRSASPHGRDRDSDPKDHDDEPEESSESEGLEALDPDPIGRRGR